MRRGVSWKTVRVGVWALDSRKKVRDAGPSDDAAESSEPPRLVGRDSVAKGENEKQPEMTCLPERITPSAMRGMPAAWRPATVAAYRRPAGTS